MTSTLLQAEKEAHLAQIQRVLKGSPPIVCFANDWRGDPTSKHHIMRIFAEYTDVIWVESSGMRRPNLLNLMDLRRSVTRLKRVFDGASRDQSATRLHVLSPLSIPLPGNPLATWINAWLYRRALKKTLKRIGRAEKPWLWVYNPMVAPYLENIPHSGLIYHCVDRWWAFNDYDSTLMLEWHSSVCRQADVVFASANALLEDCQKHTSDAYLIPHGVEWAHFAGAALGDLPRPSDLAGIDGPILGFFGLIHDWVDQDLLIHLAESFPEATLVLIGKAQVDASRLQGIRNIRLLGQKPYRDLPAYSACFDVALIPFAFNELTIAVNPIKLREYLSAGVPVVASALPEIEALPSSAFLRTARRPDEFVTAIRDLLQFAGNREMRRRMALDMSGESWEGRCEAMARLAFDHVDANGTELETAQA